MQGNTALMLAAVKGHTKVVELMSRHRADRVQSNKDVGGSCCLHCKRAFWPLQLRLEHFRFAVAQKQIKCVSCPHVYQAAAPPPSRSILVNCCGAIVVIAGVHSSHASL